MLAQAGINRPAFAAAKAHDVAHDAVNPPRDDIIPPPPPPPRRIIVVDPGHGGVDPGTIGSSGLEEKAVVLDIAINLADEIERLTKAQVKLTRDSDYFVPLEDRVAFAQSLKADLFISVHADSAPDANTRGLSIYTLSDVASDKLAAALADRENKVDTLYDVDLRHVDRGVASILFDLARRDTLNRSVLYQRNLVSGLSGRTRLLERPARSANFAVLRSPEVPAMLIENGFLSNRLDEEQLSSARYRKTLAHTIAGSLTSSILKIGAA